MKYKIKDCFELKNISDDYIVIPIGAAALEFSAVAVFNESGAFLFEKLREFSTHEELAAALIEKYGIDKELAEKDAAAFIEKLKNENMVDIGE